MDDKEMTLSALDEELPEIESDDLAFLSAEEPVIATDETATTNGETVEEVTRRLEAELADTRGEMGARIAELEGEVEALREMAESRLAEIEQLQAELDRARSSAGHGQPVNPTLLAMLHAELSESQTERERLALELEAVRADRERLQDELAGQIADLAGQLASRDATIAALERKVQQLEAQRGEPSSARLEELEAENNFLQVELDRLAAQLAQAKRS